MVYGFYIILDFGTANNLWMILYQILRNILKIINSICNLHGRDCRYIQVIHQNCVAVQLRYKFYKINPFKPLINFLQCSVSKYIRVEQHHQSVFWQRIFHGVDGNQSFCSVNNVFFVVDKIVFLLNVKQKHGMKHVEIMLV